MPLHRIPVILSIPIAIMALAVAPAAAQHDGHNHKSGATTMPALQNTRKGDPYLLDVCVVTGEELGSMGEPIVNVYDGREIRFCGKGCIKKFKSDSATYWKKVDELIIERQMPFYPFDTCMVSGEPLGGDMGEPIDFVHNNRLIRFCCNGCKRAFLKNSTAFHKQLDEAVIVKQGEDYPLQTCPVSGEALDAMGGPVEKVYGNRLVRFCCSGCVKTFEKNPTTYVAAIDNAWKKHHDHGSHDHRSHDG